MVWFSGSLDDTAIPTHILPFGSNVCNSRQYELIIVCCGKDHFRGHSSRGIRHFLFVVRHPFGSHLQHLLGTSVDDAFASLFHFVEKGHGDCCCWCWERDLAFENATTECNITTLEMRRIVFVCSSWSHTPRHEFYYYDPLGQSRENHVGIELVVYR
jgi:hypothetical protein